MTLVKIRSSACSEEAAAIPVPIHTDPALAVVAACKRVQLTGKRTAIKRVIILFLLTLMSRLNYKEGKQTSSPHVRYLGEMEHLLAGSAETRRAKVSDFKGQI